MRYNGLLDALSFQWWARKNDVRNWLTCCCAWCIRRLNPYKDRALSQHLFDLAEVYNPRPGTFDYFNYSSMGGDDDRAEERP